MEILIPGLILVALMVWASTKIKRTAAQAYEEETIEHERFSLVKPDGFICPVRSEREPAFLAYTKDFGEDESAEFRIATVEVRIYKVAGIAGRRETIAASGVEIVTDRSFELGPFPALEMEAERTENEVSFSIRYILVGENGDVLELKTEVLRSHETDNLEKIEKILSSFEIK